MSTGRRAYDLLRGYVNREYDRLSGIDRINAERELDAALDAPTFEATRGYTQTVSQAPAGPSDERAHAARILGVSLNADYLEIRKTYDRLNKRGDPSNFPEGSDERKQASEIQRRVQWAFQILTADVDTTEKRFRSLEIE